MTPPACSQVKSDLARLLHRSHVLNIKGRSYRLRELEREAATAG